MEILSIDSISSINKNEWDCLVENESPLFDYEFLLCLENSSCTNLETGWQPNHFIFKKNKKIKCLIPTYKKFNSNGEFVFDHGWANAYYRLGLQYYPKFLSAIPFTPVNGGRIFTNDNNTRFSENIKLLIDKLETENSSSFHFNFINKQQSEKLDELGFNKRVGIQYHWVNNDYSDFDDFLSCLKSKKKKNIIKERLSIKKSKIKILHLKGDEISEEDWDFFYKCYISTIEKKWSYKYLNFTFFRNLSKTLLKNRILLILAKDRNNKNIACTLNFIGKNKLFGRYWGSTVEVPFLHFELCYYQSIDYAIKEKIRIVEAGAQGEHKISRGYVPTFTYSNHWIKQKEMRMAIKDYLVKEEEIVNQNIKYLSQRIPYK